jgi:ribosome-associated heat shock protein Hsp15
MIRKSRSRLSEKIMLHRHRRALMDALTSDRASDRDLPAEPDRQRIDRWLWHARLVRTRGDAAALAGAGYVRINGARIEAPGRMVRTGDVITVALDRRVRVLKVLGFAERRGSAGAAESLYQVIE